MRNNLYYFTKGIRETLKAVKDVDLKATKKNLLYFIEVDGKKLGVHYAPDMNKMGAMFAALHSNAITKQAHILVDSHFMKCAPMVQAAVIQHEVGHYVYQHVAQFTTPKSMYDRFVFLGKLACNAITEQDLLTQRTLATRNIDHELQADAYAAEQTTQADVLTMLAMLYARTMNPEIAERYKHLSGGEALNSPFAELFNFDRVPTIHFADAFGED